MTPLTRLLSSLPSSLLPLTQWLRLTNQDLVLPFYHVVSNDYLPHISPLYRFKNEKEFERDLDSLLQILRPISLNELFEKRQKKESLPHPSFFLSFDDGLREVSEIIAPVLLRKGIPATFFVNSGFVGNKNLFFRYKAALLLDKLMRTSSALPVFPFDKKVASKSDWQAWVLNAKYGNNPELDQLGQLLEVDYTHFLRTKRPYLELDELHSLKSKGFDIGAHSIDHPEYRLVSTEEQIVQTIESLKWLRENKLESTSCFAFPFTDFGVTRATLDAIKKDSPLLLFGTAGIKLEEDRFHLQRLAMENTTVSASTLVKNELFQFQVKKMIGRASIHR